MNRRSRGTPLFTTVCALVGVLVVIQLWLLSASVEAALGGNAHPAIFGAAAQLVLFAANLGLLRYALVVERRSS